MLPNPQETADVVKFTQEIFNGKLQFFVQCTNFIMKCYLHFIPSEI